MKKKLQKISMVIVAVVLFAGVLLLSVEKNELGQWEVAAVSSFAQGGEESGTCNNCVVDMMLKPKTCVIIVLDYNGKPTGSVKTGGKIICVDKTSAVCDQTAQTGSVKPTVSLVLNLMFGARLQMLN